MRQSRALERAWQGGRFSLAEVREFLPKKSRLGGSIRGPMPTPAPPSTLDAILALQMTIAWAGEGRSEPRRLGWWQTDLIDEAGGGDLLRRLLPRTHAWAALEAVREAARRVDAQARRGMEDPDKLRTLFFLGFELDEQLSERLTVHKKGERPPADALPLPLPLGTWGGPGPLAEALHVAHAAGHTVVPGGRQLKGAAPASPDLLVAQLAAALVPFPPQYPLPFYRVKG
jgi:hypothetical protein